MITFDRTGLTAAGFGGWSPVSALRLEIGPIPAGPGTYVLLHEGETPRVLETSTGGRFKGKDPTADPALLTARLISGTPVLYIGKADDLRRRIKQLLRFGAGEPVGHWGGRYLWQLADAEQLTIAWRSEPEPLAAEGELLRDFVAQFGSLPYANLRF